MVKMGAGGTRRRYILTVAASNVWLKAANGDSTIAASFSMA
jgi:hypothetical protein